MNVMETLPPFDVMYRAVLERQSQFEGLFWVAVKTTGIFCRPTCSARKPHRQNVEFFGNVRDALFSGYRPCLRCRPLEHPGTTPPWLSALMEEIESDPTGRWRDADLSARGLDPGRVRRWFNENHGMTFHGYLRARRLGLALGQLRQGADITETAYDHGYESLSAFRDAFQKLLGQTPGRSRGRSHVVLNRVMTPLGPMLAAATEEALCLLEFCDRRMLETQLSTLQRRLNCAVTPGSNAILEETVKEIGQYFAGRRQEFSIPLAVAGTAFQESVWRALQRIPYGTTRSYQELANSIGNPAAVRAVGRANGENRIAILIPCHRVIGADGRLTGYGGGLWRKRHLLELEREQVGGEVTRNLELPLAISPA